MKLVFDDQAVADLENIFGWIAQDNPAAARSVTDRLFSSIELLISFPLIGHVGRDPDTFEWVVPRLPYVVVYEVDREQERIVVTAVFHGAQDREAETGRVRRGAPIWEAAERREPPKLPFVQKMLRTGLPPWRRSGRRRL
jgi:toxin ParE1/3/4